MLIICEGIDLTGKTTLLDKLGYENPVRLHAKLPERHPIEEYEVPLRDYNPGGAETYLLDRWHLGERIWPKVFGRPSQLDVPALRHIELFLRSRGALLVLAEAAESAITDRLKNRVEPISADQVGTIVRAFKFAARSSILPLVAYDFERDHPEKLDEIRGMANHLAGESFEISEGLKLEWVGDPRPDVLYVGERPGNGPGKPRGESCDVPFTPYKGTSGWHLMNSLPSERVAIINAFQKSGEETNLLSFWYALSEPPVVALGNAAHDALTDAKVEHGVATHPQFVRRFFHAQLPEGYRCALASAATGEDTRDLFRR